VVVEAIERGWDRLVNGELIAEAETAGFALLLTTDKNTRYQKNLTVRRVAMLFSVLFWYAELSVSIRIQFDAPERPCLPFVSAMIACWLARSRLELLQHRAVGVPAPVESPQLW